MEATLPLGIFIGIIIGYKIATKNKVEKAKD